MKKRIILMVMLISGIMTTSIFGEEGTSELQKRNNEIEAINQYEKLTENLSKEDELNIKNVSSDYYGGSYINDDGNLVVCVTDNYSVASGKIQTFTDNDDIIIQRVDYTYDTLVQNYEQTVERYHQLYKAFKENSLDERNTEQIDTISSICGIYLSVTKNKVIVEIDELNSSKIQCFKKCISNDNFIEFDEGEQITFESANAYNEPYVATEASTEAVTSVTWGPGYHLNICTTGFPVYFYDGFTRKYGFITAAHAYGTVGNPVWASGWADVIGECIDTQLGGPAGSLGGSVDAALVELKEGYTMTNVTKHGISLRNRYATILLEGSTLYKEGKTTGRTHGTMLSLLYSTTIDGTFFYNMYKTSVLSCNGDSGGVVYDSSNNIVGTIVGSSHYRPNNEPQSANTFLHSIIGRADLAVEAFGEWRCSLS